MAVVWALERLREVRFSPPPGCGDAVVVCGQQVVTADSVTIGNVVEVAPGHFRVNARAHDLWLATRDVAVAVGEVVHLRFEQVQLAAHRRDRPAPIDGHVVEALATGPHANGSRSFDPGE